MTKKLSFSDVVSHLSNRRAVEQWIGHSVENDYRTIRWIRIDREKDGLFSVTKFESFDDGSPEMLDIYAFEAVDPELQYGDAETFESLDAALHFARDTHGADNAGYVGQGMIQDEYEEFLGREGLYQTSPPG